MESQPQAQPSIGSVVPTVANTYQVETSIGTATDTKDAQQGIATPAGAQQQQDQDDYWAQRVVSDGLVKGVVFEWFQDLTRRIASVEGKIQENATQEATNGIEPAQDATLQTMKRVPEVRECNWEQFKNRYHPEQGVPAIETLVADQGLDREMEEEQLRRLDSDAKNTFLAGKSNLSATRTQANQKVVDHRIERIRINSSAVMSLLAEVTGQPTWRSDQPHVFFSPFKVPIFFHEKMEKELERLGTALSGDSTEVAEGVPVPKLEGPVDPRPAGTTSTAHQAYMEIKCYVDFVRNRLVPNYHKFDAQNHETRTKIHFSELWSLFRLGEVAVERQQDGVDQKRNQEPKQERRGTKHASERRIWKVFTLDNPVVDWKVDNLDAAGSTLRGDREFDGEKDFLVQAYRLDYDGTRYSTVPRYFWISPFAGEKDITKLPIYPLRFQKDPEALMNRLQKRGEKFQKLISYEHHAIEHDGWTLLDDPSGDPIPNPGGIERLVAAHIDSNVIIDFAEGYQWAPSWKPDFRTYMNDVWSPSVNHDKFPIIQWSGPDRTREIFRVTETVIEDDNVNELQWQVLAEKDDYIVDRDQRAERDGGHEGEEDKQVLTDENLALLPGRLVAYSLRDRFFTNVDINACKIPADIPDPFADLKIDPADKTLIRSVVHDHFEKKRVHRQLQAKGEGALEQDFIPGKGKGLIILLHGPPGVGKTATAEAVAYAHNKPLFPITCGDLGIDSNTVEERLSKIFRLANTWDCVLLLDEADIFLSRREKMDDSLQRNALVSVFLRALEYYPGVLFLTTNRVGVLDEALSSRVHISIFFKHLSFAQTHELFQNNLARARLIAEQRAEVHKEPPLTLKDQEIISFAMERYETSRQVNPNAPWWNGRQIRNAFQIATSLAYASPPDHPETGQRSLGRVHFEQIHSAIKDFTDYRVGVHRKNEDEIAHERAERAPAREARPAHRRYDSRQESARSPSPMRFTQSQFQAHTSTMITPERSGGGDFYSPAAPDSARYIASTPSRLPSELSSFVPGYKQPPQGGYGAHGPEHLLPPDAHNTRTYSGNQYSSYRAQEQEVHPGRHNLGDM
ncbi:uncharacterized protein J7T54_001018 [Emericellopsis cladophorae]|uniref:AAA+ ATPase domain-containing protein n=1 Tax=Emericellopsis cladophorae TaxID=2686198 RepID=A0A9P9XX65_9HYPO|nr:uncharacterized protein J7T54_001018 [Emericellopsis cladophorae]KAI6779288.1 hypothetical protein J7T54_001018 [Emericellopsis cladophorae]